MTRLYVSKEVTQGFSFRRRNQRGIWGYAALFLLALGIGAAGVFWLQPSALDSQVVVQQVDLDSQAQSLSTVDDIVFDMKGRRFDELKRGENLSATLNRLSVPSAQAEKFVAALSKEINLRALKPGDVVMVEGAYRKASLSEADPTATLMPTAVEIFMKDDAGIAFNVRASFEDALAQSTPHVTINRPQVHKEHAMIGGEVSGSLYASIVAGGGNAQLVNSFADIFGWQFDFYRDTRERDHYQMIVERNIVDGRVVGYGKVLAAEYAQSKDIYRGFYFESKDKGVAGYFDENGKSLKNAFLKSPVKLASITSNFSLARFHPIQKRFKPHNGVDYGAARGTPFMAVADGRVVNAGYTPFNGNWVRIKHPNGYETEYLHATKLAKGIHVGKMVQQGQVIGHVGKTGLASGYHLHFGMKKDGRYVNPAAQRFAKSISIPANALADFKKKIAVLTLALNAQSAKNSAIAALSSKRPLDG